MHHEIMLLDTGSDAELARAFHVITFLRPHLSERGFIEQVKLQASDGYKMAYIERNDEIVAVAGFRVATYLAWGRVLYVDDLIAHPEARRTGAGGALMDWLMEEGRRLGCDQIHLDSGYQRHDAHRLYLNKGFTMSSHHFSRPLK